MGPERKHSSASAQDPSYSVSEGKPSSSTAVLSIASRRPELGTKRKRTFTIYHGLALSLVLHAAVALPFVLNRFKDDPQDDSSQLVLDLDGLVSDEQAEQKVLDETKGIASQEKVEEQKPDDTPPPPPAPAAPKDPPPEAVTDDKDAEPEAAPMQPPEPPEKPIIKTQSGNPGADNVQGTQEQQQAKTIKADPEQLDEIRAYGRQIAKKIRANLIYPAQARRTGLHGATKVSFDILSNGQVRADTMKVIESSGQVQLDESALKTVRASSPFPPPPQDLPTIAIYIDFTR